jgi:hypothetical protein
VRAWALAAVLTVSLSAELAAQSAPIGQIDGSVNGPPRAVADVTVELTRVQPEPVLTFHSSADGRGRFHFDSLPVGEYALHVSSPLLDSLQLALSDRAVTVAEGRRARIEIGMSAAGAALRDAVCAGVMLGPGRGAVTGRAADADTDQPLVDATVVVSWNELVVDRATLKASNEERLGSVLTDGRGEYRLCGVPTGSVLSLQLQRDSAASAEVKVTVSDDEGAIVRDLSLSMPTPAPLSTADSAVRAPADATASSREGSPPSRMAALTGTVRGAGGQPLASAELRILGASASAVSDERGHYSLGALPAGTQSLVVRRIGYDVVEIPVELRAGRTVQRDVRLVRVISLDSMRVVALRSQYPEFEYNRKSNAFGIFLGPDEIARKKAAETSDFLTGLPGLTPSGHGLEAQVVSVHGRGGAQPCAGMRVVMNGFVGGMALNEIPASSVAAIEVYPQGAFAPTQYSVRGSCGVIVVWTKQSRRTPPPPPAGERPCDTTASPSP